MGGAKRVGGPKQVGRAERVEWSSTCGAQQREMFESEMGSEIEE